MRARTNSRSPARGELAEGVYFLRATLDGASGSVDRVVLLRE